MDPTVIGGIAAGLLLTNIGENLPIIGPFVKALKASLGMGKPVNMPADGEKITGRPILDLLLHAAIKQYGTQPVLVSLIIQFGHQVDKILDDAGIPELPINVDPPNPK